MDNIARNANGQFLMPRLALDSLSQEESIGTLKQHLKDLPGGYKEYYEQAIQRIKGQSSQDRLRGLRVLSWVSHTYQELSIEAFQHAFAISPGQANFDKDFITTPERFYKACFGLVVIRDGRVKIVHQTVLDILQTEYRQEEWFHIANRDIASTSIAYLALADFREPCKDLSARFEDHPFLQYAATYFGRHASQCTADAILHYQCLDFIKRKGGTKYSPSMSFGAFQAIMSRVLHDLSPSRILDLVYPLMHMAVLCGLERLVKNLAASNSADINATDSNKDETALHLAARTSNLSMVKLLLEHGADATMSSYSGKTALDMVMCEQYEFMYPQMVRAEEQPGFHSNNPMIVPQFMSLGWSIDWSEDRKLVQYIIAVHKRINLAADDNLSNEREEIVLTLLDHGVDVDSRHYTDQTPLQLAVLYQRPSIVKKLLEKGADPFSRRQIGLTPLNIAHILENHELSSLLQDRMALPSLAEDTGENPASLPSELSDASIISPERERQGLARHRLRKFQNATGQDDEKPRRPTTTLVLL